MKSKELLLWVVAVGALIISLVAVIGPKGLSSNAARLNLGVDSGSTLYQGPRPVPPMPCIFWTADGTQYTGNTVSRQKSDGTWETVCKADDGVHYGRNYIPASDSF